MRDRITRATTFVLDHKVEIAIGTGLFVVAVLVMKGSKPNIMVKATPEHLQGLIDNPQGGIMFEGNPEIWILNATRVD